VLRAEGISVTFGGIRALDTVGLEVETGMVTGLIGPNGAGKTTMFNVIAGLQRPTAGRIWLGDRDITGLAALRRARLGVARTFQRLEIFGSISTRDNVLVALESRRGLAPRRQRRDRANQLLEWVGLTPVADVPADVLSTGNARRLELVRALATEPKVLLLDEASSGLDSYEKEHFAELLSGVARDGVAVLLVEHDMDLVMRICTNLFVLDFGELLAEGDPETISRNATVQQAYLGPDGPSHGAGVRADGAHHA
jgi:branched-chain amino acid transport system ATP-binding protein